MKSCLHCPDRTVEPNCHTYCPVHAKVRERNELIKSNRNPGKVYDEYAFPKIHGNAIDKAR